MKIVSLLVCDDIRSEIGNKHSLMGVYDNSIEFGVTPENKNLWPKTMRIGIFVKMKFEDVDKEKEINSFKLKADYNGKIMEIAKGAFRPKDVFISHTVNLAVVYNNFAFEEPGEIKFLLESYANDNLISTISPDYTLKISEKVIK
jgi:Family of unknown function (DUF6941)